MKLREYKETLEQDYIRYKGSGSMSKLLMYIKTPGYKINVWHRCCELLEDKKWAKPLYLCVRVIYRHLCIKFGIDIPSHVKLGKGFCVFHFGGVVISAKAIIGENVSIRPNVVIGGTEKGVPIIGNNVCIGANALVIGNITVGDGAELGGGTVVIKDIPENAVVVGNPSRIVRIKE